MKQDSLPPVGFACEGLVRVGQLIDATGARPERDAVLRIEAGRITAVGQSSEFGSLALDAIDFGSERTLVPGLVDCHAHATLFPDRQPFEVQLPRLVDGGGGRYPR